MKILVTGGAGFIGSNLIQSLIKANHDICCLDDFNDYYDPRIKRENIREFLDYNSFKVNECDIQDYKKMKEIFRKENFELVVHLAARAGVRPSIAEPDLYNRVNMIGTTHLLDLAKENKVKQFIFGSTSSVYGVNSKVPFSEDDRIDKPISPYSASKIGAEMSCHVYHYLYKLNVTILRFFTVYGPRQRPEMAIHNFAMKILKGEPLPFFGDGSSRRDYTYVDDIVGGILKAIEKNFEYDVFNLGNSKTTSLAELVELLEVTLGKKAVLKRLPMQQGDVPITYADITKSRSVLGYDPKTSIKEGIEKFANWLLKK